MLRESRIALRALSEAIKKVGVSKAFKSFNNFWNEDPSVLDVPQTNIVAERGVKSMEDIAEKCKGPKYLNAHFIVKKFTGFLNVILYNILIYCNLLSIIIHVIVVIL